MWRQNSNFKFVHVNTPQQKSPKQTDAVKQKEKVKKHYTFNPKKFVPNLSPPKKSNYTIYTFGYGGVQTTKEFLDILKRSGINCLVDIRINPHCGFNKDLNGENLMRTLRSSGIHYEHMKELGNIFKDTQDDVLGSLPYSDLMHVAGELLTRRLRVTMDKYERVCIMCACGDVNSCHRNTVSGYLQHVYNYKVVNIK